MIHILIDHNIEGQGVLLWGTLASEGWVELLQIRVSVFVDAGLAFDSSDRDVWRFAQNNGMILITDNRNMDGTDSLEQTIRDEATSSSLPVLTIGKVDRFDEKDYRERCINRLLEILIDVESYLGTGRLYIP